VFEFVDSPNAGPELFNDDQSTTGIPVNLTEKGYQSGRRVRIPVISRCLGRYVISLKSCWTAPGAFAHCVAGGPKAARLSGSSTRKLVDAALASVESVFGKGPRAQLAAAYVQDWMQDPCSRGGYSYVLVNGKGAR